MSLSSDMTDQEKEQLALFESAPFVLRCGLDGTILAASSACAGLFRRTADELVGRSFLAAFNGKERRRLTHWTRSPRRDSGLVIEHSLADGTPTRRWVRWALMIITNGSRTPELLALGRDITDEREADASLRRAARWFHDFSANLRDGFAAVDLDGRIVEFNPAFVAMTGYPAPELLDLTYEDLTPQRWHAEEREIIDSQVRERGYSSLYEKEYRRRDGTIVPVELRTYLWRDDRGQPAGLWAFVRDITARRRAEEELYHSRQMLQLVLDHIPQRVFWKARDFSYMGCNKTFALDAGLTDPTEISGRDDFQLPWRDTAPLYRADDRQVIETGSGRFNFEEPQSRTDGRELWLRTSKVPLRNRDGEVIGVLGTYEDITEHKRAEQALVESEERYRELVENINEVLFILDRRGTIEFISPVIKQISGVPPEEVIGQPFSHYLHPEDVPAAYELFERAKTGDSVVTELRIITGGGLPHWFSISVRPIKNNGRLMGLRGLLSDIHVRRQTEEALRDSQEYLSSLMSLVADPIITVSMPQRIIEYANRAAQDVFGHSAQELIGESTRLFYADEGTFATFASHVDAALARGETHLRLEQQLIRSDGSMIWAELMTTFLFSGGRLAKTINVIRDVTERRKMEEALRRSQETQRAILAAMPDLTFLLGRDGTFLDFLSGAPGVLLNPPEEFLGRPIHEVLPGDLARVTMERIELACTSGKLQTYAYDLEINGQTRRFDARMVALGRSAALAVVQDVTERRHVEEQLLQAQKMEAIGRLAGGAAHDFNNLLQAMLSHVDLLRAVRGDATQVDATAKELEQQIRRGAGLTRQLLLFSRRETARQELLDLNSVVLGAADLLRRLIRENVTFNVVLADGPLSVEVDRGQIEQVLMNLAVNACDAMPEGGRLILATAAEDSRTVAFSVTDTGCGITPELRDRIFEPFFTTKAPDAGTGLGLSVVHGIVARHDGRIELETTEGQGSTFRVTLPRADRPAPAEHTGTDRRIDPLPSGHGERVLLVEDEDAARNALEQTLTMLGYQVVAAASGAAAMRIVDGPPFDLILTDLLLPDIFGADLARHLRGHWPNLRVLLMSGYTANEEVRDSVQSGRVRFLQKPFDLATMARELRAALDESVD